MSVPVSGTGFGCVLLDTLARKRASTTPACVISAVTVAPSAKLSADD
jgi:hypothetical protein